MTTPGGTDYIGTIRGTLDPGTLYPFPEIFDYIMAQREMHATTRTALGAPGDADFYLIARLWSSEAVYRARWTLEAELNGPFLLAEADGPYETTIQYRIRKYPASGEKRQIITAPEDDYRTEMPYRDLLSGLYPALMLRKMWGTGARTLTLGSRGTVTFTPSTLEYLGPGAYQETVVDYLDNPLAEYRFEEPQQETRQPALWMSPTGSPIGAGWKVSYCTETGGTVADRWDDPNEPVPAYAPLDPPPVWTWPPG